MNFFYFIIFLLIYRVPNLIFAKDAKNIALFISLIKFRETKKILTNPNINISSYIICNRLHTLRNSPKTGFCSRISYRTTPILLHFYLFRYLEEASGNTHLAGSTSRFSKRKFCDTPVGCLSR